MEITATYLQDASSMVKQFDYKGNLEHVVDLPELELLLDLAQEKKITVYYSSLHSPSHLRFINMI